MNQPAGTVGRPVFNDTQLGLARRFVERFGRNLRYSYARRAWLYWDGRRWTLDDGSRVELWMKNTVDLVFYEAAETASSDERKARVKFALRMEKRTDQKAALELARSEPGIPVDHAQLDSDPWLLNVRNGTIDLRDGSLQEHRREDLMTHLCDLEFDRNAGAPRWDRFLTEIIPDPEVRRFLKKAIGYSLTGDVREHMFFICHGPGANGKTVLFEIVMALLSDLAIKCPSDTVARNRGTGIPNDIARLVGKRFAAVVELEDGLRLAESRIKEIVGADTITARFMKGEWFDFRPMVKLWLASNYRPNIKGTDYGMWRRVCLIPFEVTIQNPDRELTAKLVQELPGILRWAVEGCADWRAEGLEPPERVRLATAGYQSAEDVIGRFLDDECVIEDGRMVKKGELYEALEGWCEVSGEETPSKRKLSSRLTDLGMDESRTGSARYWLGIRLRSSQ